MRYGSNPTFLLGLGNVDEKDVLLSGRHFRQAVKRNAELVTGQEEGEAAIGPLP